MQLAAKQILLKIKTDREQYDALLQSIGAEPENSTDVATLPSEAK